MSGPPDNIEAQELWRKLNETPRPSRVVDFPRKDADGNPVQKVRIQVLGMDHHDQARAKAKAYLTGEKMRLRAEELDFSPGREMLGDATAVELLAMAVVSVNPLPGSTETSPKYGRLFTDQDGIRKSLTSDEIAALFAMYVQIQREIGPTELSFQSQEELTAWVKRLEQGASAVPLAPYDSHQLADLALSLAGRVSSLSRILASLCLTSPDIMASIPESWAIGTFSAGEQPETSTTESGEDSGERLLNTAEGESITVADAMKAAEALRNA